MARVTDGGQKSFTDQPLPDAELEEACETILANKDAVAEDRRAKAVRKERVPTISEPTRFIVGERYFIYATPYEADGHEVSGGARQRNRVVHASED